MLSDIKEILKSKLLLSPDKIEMIENGPGFRINDHGFVCEKIGDFSWKVSVPALSYWNGVDSCVKLATVDDPP